MSKLIVCVILILPNLFFGQHIISGRFSPAEDYNVALLYKVTPTISEYITNAEISKDGTFQFQLDSTHTKGMYRLVYAIPQEDYNFDIIYNGKEDIKLTFNSETGVKFQSSSENKLLSSYTNSMSLITHSIGNFFREESNDTIVLKSLFKTQSEAQANYEKLAKGTIAYHFIKANKPFIPKTVIKVKPYIDSLKTHYFDHVDFNNKTLQASNFLEERMLNYVFGMSSETLDEVTNYKNNIDVFYSKVKSVPNDVKRILLVDLWQQMIDLEFENVANYISDKYLMTIAKTLNDKELIEGLTAFSRTAVGSKAPDFSFQIVNKTEKTTKKLSELTGFENYVIFFWSSTCLHCLDEIPQLQEFVKCQDKGVLNVVAIGLEDEPKTWNSLKKSFTEFIHVYGKGKWENSICKDYNVHATPSYFLLNKNKDIIAKPENVEALKELFEEAD